MTHLAQRAFSPSFAYKGLCIVLPLTQVLAQGVPVPVGWAARSSKFLRHRDTLGPEVWALVSTCPEMKLKCALSISLGLALCCRSHSMLQHLQELGTVIAPILTDGKPRLGTVR